MPTSSLLAELSWRGLLSQHTDGLEAALAAGRLIAYAGFDPTAPSLHVGSLVPVMGLVHLQRTGNVPIALVGGGTGMIGDPSGKSTERQLLTRQVIEANSRAIGAQLARFLDFTGASAAIMGDNADWLLPLGAVEMLRDVGKHFTVNYMLAKESVKTRLETGISFTEFSYMLLQAYDYLQLHERHGATLQIGGSDQWGNITAGIELIRRVAGHESHALTLPLVTTAAGAKFGKTEAGAVYLDPAMTSPYQFYQFWINADDRDVPKWLRYFTLLDRPTIESLDRETQEHPERRAAQRTLAEDMTTRVHGADVLRTAVEVSALLFGGKEPAELSARAFEALAAEIPTANAAWTSDGSPDGRTLALQDALVTAKLATSKSDARRTIQQGGVTVNGVRASSDAPVVPSQCLHGSYVLLKKGAKNYALLRMTG
ncbi:MAG TPA: tyrosine--tRNA ligase [Gemmatimonadaceae bacterium]|nr:tyrosine--tRNA ligase [Gemmatimonadaceae bacterium]